VSGLSSSGTDGSTRHTPRSGGSIAKSARSSSSEVYREAI